MKVNRGSFESSDKYKAKEAFEISDHSYPRRRSTVQHSRKGTASATKVCDTRSQLVTKPHKDLNLITAFPDIKI